MALGKITALLGALNPATDSPPVPDLAQTDAAVSGSSGTGTNHRHADPGATSDMATQIKAIVAAIRQLHDNTSQEGAGMAFSRSGATLRDTVGALGHLVNTARETGAALPDPLVRAAAEAVGAVESELSTVQAAVDHRAHSLSASDEARVRDTTGRFVAEMQAVIAATRGALARFGG